MVAFTAVAGLWWLIEGAAYMNILPVGFAASIRPVAAWITFPFALGVVIYTAFLLGQAEGRDLWQSPLLPFQLFSQSMLVASGVFLALNSLLSFPVGLISLLQVVFPTSLIANLLLTLTPKVTTFASEVAQLASREMTHGRFRNHFWWGGIALGHLAPLALFLVFSSVSLPIAVVCVIVGLFFYEYAFVMAPQYIPNS
jgi:hypothetical protein